MSSPRPLAALAAALLAAASPGAAARAAAPPMGAVDYADAANWICRPGREATCTTELNALEVRADGGRTPRPFRPAAAPAVDCFYVYPTVSHETSDYSDLQASPEVEAVVRDQAGRLTSLCRLFAPVYRQLTSSGLKHALDADPKGGALNWDAPYRDVRAAWRDYLRRDNHGRGVVLVGHSQGTILLQRLIAEEIDGRPVQARLVAAFLAGDPSLPVPVGARTGGAFKSVPLCAASAQTGCAYVWADYRAQDAATPLAFGVDPGKGLAAGCVDPAAPSGGTGALTAYLPRPAFAPDADPPWVEVRGQLSVACVDDGRNHVARVTVLPTRFHDLLETAFDRASSRPGWGLHTLDMALTQSAMLDRVADETAAWTARPAHP